MVKSIDLGKSADAVKWIQGLQSDGRAGAISALSAACVESESIQSFFVSQAETLGDDFWEQRWYRSLGDCKVEPIQNLLSSRLESGLEIGRSQYLGVLEVYARNAEGAAMADIKKALEVGIESSDAELQVNAIMAFSDAAQVSGTEIGNAKAAQRAVKFISEKNSTLAPKALAQARLTLQSLGSEEAADELVQYAFADLVQEDGSLLWGIVAIENATCKNKKEKQFVHTGKVVDGAKRTWPDQLKPAARAAAKSTWGGFNLADSCKGSGTVKVFVPEMPFADEAAYEAWVAEIVGEHKRTDIKKVQEAKEEDVVFN
jgi:hypothetical protein